jgi:hypothetical protein
MDSPPEIVIYPASEPLTPPATPDRRVNDQTPSKQHKKRQVAEKPDASLLTPPSIPPRTKRSHQQKTPHQQTESPTKQQQQHDNAPPQHVLPPTPAEELQACRLERRAAMHQDPTYIANSERKRVIRERDSAARKERIELRTRRTLGSGDDYDDSLDAYTVRLRRRSGSIVETGRRVGLLLLLLRMFLCRTLGIRLGSGGWRGGSGWIFW